MYPATPSFKDPKNGSKIERKIDLAFASLKQQELLRAAAK